MRRGFAVSTSMALAFLLSERAASGETRRVALLNADAELVRAVSIALSPWALQVVALDAQPPPPWVPEAADEARELSVSLDAGAVVWVSVTEKKSAVWVYDAATQRVTSRAQEQLPPFDAPAAAAVALSLKTLLRTSELAPQGERFGATMAPRSPWPGRLRLEVSGGARGFAANAFEPWLVVGAVIWTDRPQAAWGLSLRAAFTTGANVENDSLSGVVREIALSPALRRWFTLSGDVAIVPFAGASLRLTRLDATIAAARRSVSIEHGNPSVDFGVAVPFRVAGPLDVGPYGAGSYLLHYQRYLVGGAVGFEARPFSFEFGVQASTTVF
jgi:hypothetical protein